MLGASRVALLALGACTLGGSVMAVGSRLQVNVTPSVPTGLYWLSPAEQVQVGQVVSLPIPPNVEAMVRQRYLPTIRFLLKPVAAVAPTHVCLRDGGIYLDGSAERFASIPDTDSAGRPLPSLSLCRLLHDDEVFLASRAPNSLDSRFFGPVRASELQGTAELLW